MKKTPQMTAIELNHAKELLAEHYMKNIEALENSQHPMETLRQIGRGALVEENAKTIETKTIPVYIKDSFDNHPDAQEALKALAEKELAMHHRGEQITLQERYIDEQHNLSQMRDTGLMSDEEFKQKSTDVTQEYEHNHALLSDLHAREETLFERSDTPLENTRAIIEDAQHFTDFETYVLERINLEEHIQDIEHEKNQSREDQQEFEAHIKGHLQEQAAQLKIDNAPETPALLADPAKNDLRFTHQYPGESLASTHREDHTLDSGTYAARNTTLTYDPTSEEVTLPDQEYHSLDHIGDSQEFVNWQSESHEIDGFDNER